MKVPRTRITKCPQILIPRIFLKTMIYTNINRPIYSTVLLIRPYIGIRSAIQIESARLVVVHVQVIKVDIGRHGSVLFTVFLMVSISTPPPPLLVADDNAVQLQYGNDTNISQALSTKLSLYQHTYNSVLLDVLDYRLLYNYIFCEDDRIFIWFSLNLAKIFHFVINWSTLLVRIL